MSQRVALAASGSENGRAVEEFAFTYCRHHQVDELLVIHIIETDLARYGEIEQLASGNCKADFINYIREKGRTTAQQLHSHILAMAAQHNKAVKWVELEGEIVTQVSRTVKENEVSTLIVGKGQEPVSFFSPPKKTAQGLVRTCSCRVITVPLEP